MRKRISIMLACLAAMLTLAGCGGKVADAIVLPKIAEIDSLEITTTDGMTATCTDSEWIEQLLETVTQAKPTAKQSVQDSPNVERYGKVDIANNGGVTTFFYYDEGGKRYIEQPYQGIYEIDVDLDTLAAQTETMTVTPEN